MSNITQCVQLFAEGSSITSAKLFVALGAPVQASGGDVPEPYVFALHA
jgi:hypothetical protein